MTNEEILKEYIQECFKDIPQYTKIIVKDEWCKKQIANTLNFKVYLFKHRFNEIVEPMFKLIGKIFKSKYLYVYFIIYLLIFILIVVFL